jgi:hypothetical protein
MGILVVSPVVGLMHLTGLFTIYSLIFYHKISGRSMELLLPEINYFKQLIIDRLCKPVHQREMEYYHDLGERNPPNK